jgi:hypothetical protein
MVGEISHKIIAGSLWNNAELDVRITGGTVNYLVYRTVATNAYIALPLLRNSYHRAYVFGRISLAGCVVYMVIEMSFFTSLFNNLVKTLLTSVAPGLRV